MPRAFKRQTVSATVESSINRPLQTCGAILIGRTQIKLLFGSRPSPSSLWHSIGPALATSLGVNSSLPTA